MNYEKMSTEALLTLLEERMNELHELEAYYGSISSEANRVGAEVRYLKHILNNRPYLE